MISFPSLTLTIIPKLGGLTDVDFVMEHLIKTWIYLTFLISLIALRFWVPWLT